MAPPVFVLQDLQFEAEREAQIVFGFQVTVSDLVYQIQVAGAEFVKERDGFVPALIGI